MPNMKNVVALHSVTGSDLHAEVLAHQAGQRGLIAWHALKPMDLLAALDE